MTDPRSRLGPESFASLGVCLTVSEGLDDVNQGIVVICEAVKPEALFVSPTQFLRS